MTYYYLDASRQTIGPMSFEDLRQLHEDGLIGEKTLVVAHGAQTWVAYGTLAAELSGESREAAESASEANAVLPVTNPEVQTSPEVLPGEPSRFGAGDVAETPAETVVSGTIPEPEEGSGTGAEIGGPYAGKVCPTCNEMYPASTGVCRVDGTALVDAMLPASGDAPACAGGTGPLPAESSGSGVTPNLSDVSAVGGENCVAPLEKVCSSCSNTYPASLDFCSVDGTPLIVAVPQNAVGDAREKGETPIPSPQSLPVGLMCPICGLVNAPGLLFCIADGVRLEGGVPGPTSVAASDDGSWRCPNCGSDYPSEIRLCPKDGFLYTGSVSRKQGSPRWLIPLAVGLSLAMVLVLATIFLLMSRLTPEKAQAKVNGGLREANLSSVQATVNDRWEATLTGTLPDRQEKDRAVALVRSWDKITQVWDQIEVNDIVIIATPVPSPVFPTPADATPTPLIEATSTPEMGATSTPQVDPTPWGGFAPVPTEVVPTPRVAITARTPARGYPPPCPSKICIEVFPPTVSTKRARVGQMVTATAEYSLMQQDMSQEPIEIEESLRIGSWKTQRRVRLSSGYHLMSFEFEVPILDPGTYEMVLSARRMRLTGKNSERLEILNTGQKPKPRTQIKIRF